MRISLASVAILTLAACAGDHAPQARQPAALPPVDVRTEILQPTPLDQEIALIGSVAAQSKVAVAAKVMSYVQAVHAREGSTVRAGQTLIDLDSQEMETGLAAAQATHAEAEAAIATSAQVIAAAEAQRDLAASTHKRFEDLLDRKSVAPQEYDEISARLRSAEAALALARSQKTQAEARLAHANAAIAQANLQLGYAKVVSPVNGIVVRRLVDPGALASPGMPLLEIEQRDAYRLEVAVPESQAGHLRLGQQLSIQLEAFGESDPLSGRIVEIVPAVDPGSRTFIAKIALPNDARLRSGLYGKALLAGPKRQGLTVAASAVVDRGQLRSVFVVEDDRVRRRLVTLGEQRAGRIEVLSGLTAGDVVVLDPANAVDGAPAGARS